MVEVNINRCLPPLRQIIDVYSTLISPKATKHHIMSYYRFIMLILCMQQLLNVQYVDAASASQATDSINGPLGLFVGNPINMSKLIINLDFVGVNFSPDPFQET